VAGLSPDNPDTAQTSPCMSGDTLPGQTGHPPLRGVPVSGVRTSSVTSMEGAPLSAPIITIAVREHQRRPAKRKERIRARDRQCTAQAVERRHRAASAPIDQRARQLLGEVRASERRRTSAPRISRNRPPAVATGERLVLRRSFRSRCRARLPARAARAGRGRFPSKISRYLSAWPPHAARDAATFQCVQAAEFSTCLLPGPRGQIGRT